MSWNKRKEQFLTATDLITKEAYRTIILFINTADAHNRQQKETAFKLVLVPLVIMQLHC